MSAETPAGTEPSATGERVLLDNRRIPCAVGLIKAARTIADLESGTVLEIWSRDRFAPMEIPIWAERDGHLATALGRRGRWPTGYYVFEVVKDALPG
ncbi:MAG TPA: sulfurtransferase TusA family protein [Intrasporangiaceae bacterium]|nr:sulfurtransferase TusA family protein [Intrasporangiaceae bacterium]